MAAAVLALLAGFSGVAEAHPNTASAAGTAITAAEDAKACGPLPAFPAGTADQIMAGRLTISGFATVTIDPNRDGHVNWAQDPFGNPTWLVDFQNAQWIEALIRAYLAGGPNADAYRDRAKTLLLGWLSQVPADNRTPDTLICSAEAFPGQSWIDDQIPGLLRYYASHWDGAYNHGLKQSLQLLGAGCAYPSGAFGGAAGSWRETARQQMIDSFEPNVYGPAIDAHGVTNEQSTGYANFDFGLWSTAESDLAACGSSLPGWIKSRIALMPEFLAQATQPNGKLVQIGDTYVVSARYRAGTPLQYAVSLGDVRHAPGAADRSLFGRVRVRAVLVGDGGDVRGPVVLLAALRARHRDPRPRRSHGADLLRGRPQSDRRRRSHRVRGHAVPRLPALAGGGQRPGDARRALRLLSLDLADPPGHRRAGAVLRVLRHRFWRAAALPQRLRRPGPGPGAGL